MKAAMRSVMAMAIIFVVAQLGALLMASSVLSTQNRAFENPNDPLIPIIYLGAIVGFTFLVLYIIRKKRENVIKAIFIGAVAFTIFYVLLAIGVKLSDTILSLIIPLIITGILTYLLVKRPEWYVIDASGILMAIGIIGIFGISLSILPVFVLLIALAIYDAISVYGTRHMVALADGVTKMRLPILLVIPKKLGYSYLKQKPLKEQLDSGEEREAMFMGLGDVIIPGVLVASAFSYLKSLPFHGFESNLIVALGTLIGSLVGFLALMRFVLSGRPQAGLPLLNGGAMVGYILTYLLVYRDLSLGITLG